MDMTKLTKPARKLLPLKTCGAVIVAAGNASRMGGIDKVMAQLKVSSHSVARQPSTAVWISMRLESSINIT